MSVNTQYIESADGLQFTGTTAFDDRHVQLAYNRIEIDWDNSGTVASYNDLNSEIRISELAMIRSESNDNTFGTIDSTSCKLLDSGNGALRDMITSYAIEGSRVTIFKGVHSDSGIIERTVFVGKVTAPIAWADDTRELSLSFISRVEGDLISAYNQDLLENDDYELEHPPICFGTVRGVKCASTEIMPTLTTMTTIYQYVTRGGGSLRSGRVRIRNGNLMPQGVFLILEIDRTKFGGRFQGDIFVITDFNMSYGSVSCKTRDYNSQYGEACDNIWLQKTDEKFQGKYGEVSFSLKHWVMDANDGTTQLVSLYPEEVPTYTGAVMATYDTTQVVQVTGWDNVSSTGLVQLNDVITGAFGQPVEVGRDGKFSNIRGKPLLSSDTYKFVESVPQAWQIQAGTSVRLYMKRRQYYANWLPSQRVHCVYAKFNGQYCPIPRSWVSITLAPHTIITVRIAPTYYEWDSDELYVTLTSSIGPNPVHVLRYIADNYTKGSLTFDDNSYYKLFDRMRAYPCGFAVTQPEDSLELMQTLLWESHLAMTIKHGVAYISDKAQKPDTDSFVLDSKNCVLRSYALSTTDSADLYTIFKFRYRKTYFDDDSTYTINVTKNQDKFGDRRFDYEFKCYNNRLPVSRAVEFYVERYGNMWVLFSAQSFLCASDIMANDSVAINTNVLSVQHGAVISREHSTDNELVDLQVWTPWSTTNGVPFFDWHDQFPKAEPDDYMDWVPPIRLESIMRRRDANVDGAPLDDGFSSIEYGMHNDGTDFYIINSIHNNCLRCTRVYKTNTNEYKQVSSAQVYVAMPVGLRRVQYDGKTFPNDPRIISATFSAYSNTAQTRLARYRNNTIRTEKIAPAYFVGEIIKGTYVPGGVGLDLKDSDTVTNAQTGLITIIDTNTAGRSWQILI